MLTKTDVRAMVHALLAEQVADAFLRKQPDEYYGYVPPQTRKDGTTVPGYWLGEPDKQAAKAAMQQARIDFDCAVTTLEHTDPANAFHAVARAQADAAAAAYYASVRRYEDVALTADRAIEARRQLIIERRVAKLFYRMYQRACKFDWDLYNPAIPEDLRRYVIRQRQRGVMSPTSIVLLYLITQHTIEHGEDFQQLAMSGQDYLVTNPLVTADLDIEAVENEPSKQRKQYLKALQYQLAYEAKPPAHENYDQRDALADFEYHGLPEQLGALWLDKDGGCEKCGTPMRVKMIHAKGGYRYATVCSNYRTGCYLDPQSPIFATRREVRDWAIVEWATTQAA